MEVEMKIRGLMMDPITNMPIVILKEAAGSNILPIWVGVYEANAIQLEIGRHAPADDPRLDQERAARPSGLCCKIVVTNIKDDTFYAVIWIEREGQTISIDSRPSDASRWRFVLTARFM